MTTCRYASRLTFPSMNAGCRLLCFLFALVGTCLPGLAEEPRAKSAADLVPWLLADEKRLVEIPFPEIIFATSGKKVLPLDKDDATDQAILHHIQSAAATVLAAMNAADSPVKGLRRINEASRHFEDALQKALTRGDFTCAFPVTASGDAQRSGYPDLQVVHRPSGRVTYVDPKLFEEKSRHSTLRTFYFEPRGRTNKVTKDARHLLLGIAHDGKDGDWSFSSFHLVDLSQLKVQLKAEFQASNKDVYREENIVGGGRAK